MIFPPSPVQPSESETGIPTQRQRRGGGYYPAPISRPSRSNPPPLLALEPLQRRQQENDQGDPMAGAMWRRIVHYVKHDLREFANPSAMPNPPGYLPPPRRT